MSEQPIEVPIEISKADLKELRDLEERVEQTKKKADKIKDKSSRQAVPTQGEEERGGIFGGAREVKVAKPKDKTSKQAFQRQNEFKKLRDQVKDLEKNQEKLGDSFKEVFGGDPLSTLGGLKGGIGGTFGIFAKSLAPVMGPILIAEGFANLIVPELFKPGSPFDRRFRREIRKEITSASEKREKTLFEQGLKIARVTPYPGFRGRGTTRGADQIERTSITVNRDLEFTLKGVNP